MIVPRLSAFCFLPCRCNKDHPLEPPWEWKWQTSHLFASPESATEWNDYETLWNIMKLIKLPWDQYHWVSLSITVGAELCWAVAPRQRHMRCVIWPGVDQPSDQKSRPGQWSWSDGVDHRSGGLLRPHADRMSSDVDGYSEDVSKLVEELGRPALSSVVFPDPLGPKMQVSLPALKVPRWQEWWLSCT